MDTGSAKAAVSLSGDNRKAGMRVRAQAAFLRRIGAHAMARDLERSQTTIEFSITWIPAFMIIVGGLMFCFAMVQVAMFDHAISQADWAVDMDSALVAADPAAAIEEALVLKNPTLDGHIRVSDAEITSEWKPTDEVWESTADRGTADVGTVTMRTAVRHVEAVVTYDIAAAVPFTEITKLTRTVTIDRDVVVTHDFRIDTGDSGFDPPISEHDEASGEEEDL